MEHSIIGRIALVALLIGLCGTVDAHSWRGYEIIMWQPQTSEQYATLRALGITAGTVKPENADHPETLPKQAIGALLSNHLRWYVENIATDFYSAYHRWFSDRPVNWRFEVVKKRYNENSQDRSALVREPSLSDPKWLAAIRTRLLRVVRAQRAYRPLFYDLGDEMGIGDLSVFWDFDFSDASLRGFRRWLRQQYRSLAALNAEWRAHFTRWRDVMPNTTQQAIAREDGNFAAWADFREWMDVAFAQALKVGRDAVHAADPDALAGMEGGQVPGWGGYDYSRLAHAVDVMELYDGGGNLEIVRSLNPRMVILTTSSDRGPPEVHRIWRELLRGSRGTILWDPNSNFVRENSSDPASPAAALREIRTGIGPLLVGSQHKQDPIAILYSPESMRVQWMLDWKPRGDAWSRRETSAAYEDASVVRDAMVGYARILEHIGLNPTFLTSKMVGAGKLRSDHIRALILPHVIALDPSAARAIRDFARHGGLVIADVEPGLFDRHGRKLSQPLLRNLRDSNSHMNIFYLDPEVANCSETIATNACRSIMERLSQSLDEAHVHPVASMTTSGGAPVSDCELYVFRRGTGIIIALQRDRAPAAGDSGSQHETGAENPERIVLTLRQPAYLFNLRTKHAMTETTQVDVALDPYEPTILLASPAPLSTSNINRLYSEGRRVR